MKVQLYTIWPRWGCFVLMSLVLPILVSAQNHDQGGFTSVGDALWQLQNLSLQPDLTSNRKPSLGGQNFTHCCLLAMNQSLQIVDGVLVQKPHSFIDATPNDLLAASAAGQFPCGASWNGDSKGAPKVIVTSKWVSVSPYDPRSGHLIHKQIHQYCPGWQLSDSSKGDESEWISPFVGFLLPAVIFCESTRSSHSHPLEFIRLY